MMKNCNICNNELRKVFTKKVLKKYDVTYSQCKNCGLLQPENVYWLEEAYRSPISTTDSGYLGRNILMSRITLVIFYSLFKTKDAFLDFAGGYGLFARLMNDYGLKFFWEDKYTQGIFAGGLEYNNQKIKAVTCFECFEHFQDPVTEFKKILELSNTVLFSTTLLSEKDLPDTETWGYYGFEHGQHIAFYTEKSLRTLAEMFNLHFYTDGKNIHMITHKKISNILFTFLVFLPKLQIDFLLKKLIIMFR